MRLALIILTIVICSCSSKQRTKQLTKNDSTSIRAEIHSSYDLLLKAECEHLNLSNEFDIEVYFERHTNTKDQHDSCMVKLLLRDKKTKKLLDSIFISSHFYLEDTFIDCKNVLSYPTKFNIDKEVVDNYYGDLIIADLNFDNKDDITVINDFGGNGGTFYSYFLQSPGKKFILDKFLTDSMTYFPTKINSKDKTLVTYVHAGVCWLGEHVYNLDKTNKWTEKSHKTIDICKD